MPDISKKTRLSREERLRRKKKAFIIAVISAVIIVLAGVFLAIFLPGKIRGANASKTVNAYMKAYCKADSEKMLSLSDKNSSDYEDMKQTANELDTLASSGAAFDISYTVRSKENGGKQLCKEVSNAYYGGGEKIKAAWIFTVSYDAAASYNGQSNSTKGEIVLLCYKKGGDWFIGNPIETK